ncbi:MAG: DciA family protein [Candidatus Omnitrophota bacterium]|nr:DciA family protein [Candidatus Omnitrophota bacterium]
MEIIKETVINVIRELSSKKEKGINQTDAWALLKKALTKKELRHIKFNYFKKGILGIRVDSSVWLYNFNLKKEKLLAFLNNNPGIQLKDIRFNLGEIK